MDEPWADQNEVSWSLSIVSDLRTLLADMCCGPRETPENSDVFLQIHSQH